jgi:glutathionylspermidine synthase
MATSSSTMMTINLMPVGEKLSRGNHVLWKAQVLTVLRGVQLAGFLDGTNNTTAEKIVIKSQKESNEDSQEVPNPAFALWKAQEQQVLSYLLTSVSRDVLIQIVALPSATEVWKHIQTSFVSQSRARVINTRMALVTTQKGSSTVAEYISKMKTLADEMASAGKKLDDEELTSYILARLDSEYNSIVSSIAARVEPISFGELYSQRLAHENRLDIQNGGQQHSHLSVNNAS